MTTVVNLRSLLVMTSWTGDVNFKENTVEAGRWRRWRNVSLVPSPASIFQNQTRNYLVLVSPF